MLCTELDYFRRTRSSRCNTDAEPAVLGGYDIDNDGFAGYLTELNNDILDGLDANDLRWLL